MFASPLVLFALAIPPIVAVVFIAIYCVKSDPVSQPSLVAAVPLCLTSIAILLSHSAVVLLAAFQAIAQQRTAGFKAVIDGMLLAQRPLSWGLLDVALCLTAIVLCLVVLRYQRDEEAPLMRAFVSLPALIATAVVAVVLFLMVYLQYSTVDLVMMICDKHRLPELAAQYGNVSPGFFASRISSRLVAITFISVIECIALVGASVLALLWRQKQNPRQAFAAVLTLGALICCAAGALSEFGFVDYVAHLK
ncbi:MAG TPA: hypothetical protein VGJ21_21135 [Terracidiphilus sp.]|jgi:hypothetical protein